MWNVETQEKRAEEKAGKKGRWKESVFVQFRGRMDQSKREGSERAKTL
jgi:hypothetical protein